MFLWLSIHMYPSMILKSPLCGWPMAIPWWCVTLSGCWGWLLRCSNYFLYGDIGLFRDWNIPTRYWLWLLFLSTGGNLFQLKFQHSTNPVHYPMIRHLLPHMVAVILKEKSKKKVRGVVRKGEFKLRIKVIIQFDYTEFKFSFSHYSEVCFVGLLYLRSWGEAEWKK